jgi:phytoene dehydrogenase-like protein
MTQKTRTTVVGGGLAGLVAAITVAEAGGPVDLHETHSQLGGRARSSVGPFVANLGPHALYSDGPLWTWLGERGARPSCGRPPHVGFRVRSADKLRRVPPPALVRAYLHLRRVGRAPVDESFAAWAGRHVGDHGARLLSNLAGVFTFSDEPGRWSAAFVWERVVRVTALPPVARYPLGGWAALVDALVTHARVVGVTIHPSSTVEELPEGGPVIVATDLGAARRLLGDATLTWPSGRAALLDLGIEARPGDPFIVSDLDEGGWVERFSASDASLAPAGHSLLQAQIGTHDDEPLDAAIARLETLVGCGYRDWRSREVWRRRSLVDGRSGALDPPGTTWRDRPSVDRGHGVFVCGDQVAAPGLLAEVSWASAVEAGRAAAAAAQRGSRTTSGMSRSVAS